MACAGTLRSKQFVGGGRAVSLARGMEDPALLLQSLDLPLQLEGSDVIDPVTSATLSVVTSQEIAPLRSPL